MNRVLRLFALLLIAAVPSCKMVQVPPSANTFTPFQLSIWPDWPDGPRIQLAPANWDVDGVRLNLFAGVNYNIRGLDIGVMNVVIYKVSGLQAGLLCNSDSDTLNGVQVAGLINMAAVHGVQIAGLSNVGPAHGVQLAMLINCADDEMNGMNGAQLALFNDAEKMRGAQIGLLNYSKDSSGVQFGLLNFMKDGFLPFFPLINFNFSHKPAQ